MPDRPSLDEIFGEITEIGKTPPFGQRLLARTERVGALATKGLFGDIPFIRKAIPPVIGKISPAYGYEEPIEPLTRLGRDIFALKGIGKLGLLRTGLRGAGIGMATAGTEKPEEILGAGVKGAMALPLIKKATDIATEKVIKPLFQKGLKTTRQMWQDLIRAGYMVEKGSVQRAQEKGIDYLMNKKVGFRNSDAFLKLGEDIHNKALDLRRYWGDKVGRFRNLIFKNPKIKVSIMNARDMFQNGLRSPDIGLLAETGEEMAPVGLDPIKNKLLEVNRLISMWGDEVNPDIAYQLVDKVDDLLRTGKGMLGKHEGVILAKLRDSLKQQIYKSAPRYISARLKAVEQRFGEVADITDDVFDKLKFAKEGVASAERIGATETALKRGLKADTPTQEKQVWENLNRLLPKDRQFMERYKDIFAAQDFSKEGIGWFLRRLFLAPRMAAAEMGVVQPLFRATGKALETGYGVGKTITPPILFRKTIEGQKKPTLDEIFE